MVNWNPFLYLKLDEGSGTTTADETGHDTLTVNGSPTWTTGKVGTYQIDFDGSNDYVLSDTAVGLTNGNVSISAWAQADSTVRATERYIAGVGDIQTATNGHFMGIKTGRWQISRGGTDDVDTGIQADKLVHLHVMTYDGTNTKYYLDGRLITSQAVTSSITDSKFVVGASLNTAGAATNFFDGRIDEVGLWTGRALSAEEVLELYNRGNGLAYNTQNYWFCTITDAIKKAGELADATIVADVERISKWIEDAESYINLASRYNWSANIGSLSQYGRNLLRELSSNLVAQQIIVWNMAGYTTRAEATTILDVLQERINRTFKVLEDQNGATFLRNLSGL